MTQEELVRRWLVYKEATVAKPYNPDHVQALGMRFADAWHAACIFDYDIKDIVMPALCTRVQLNEESDYQQV